VTAGSARLTAFATFGTVLASVVLVSVIQGGPWFWQAVAAAGLVGLVGVGGRRVGAPRPLTAVGQLAALVAYLTWLFASEPAVAGLYPGPAAVRELDLVATSGMADIENSVAPVAPSPGVALIAVAGIGLMALLVDLLAVAYRHTALAGLPLLALYSVPASVLRDGVNALLFLFPAAGFLGMLLAEGRERVLQWGRPLSGSGSDGPSARNVVVSVSATELNQLGRRIGVAALGLAVVVPAVLPQLPDGVLGGTGSGVGDGVGGSRTIATLNALVTLRRDLTRADDVDVLRVRTDAPDPADLYLRAVTLDVFDGQDWRASSRRVRRFDSELPAAQGLTAAVAARTIHTRVQVTERLRSDYLPVPYPVRRVVIDGEWRVDPETQNLVSQRGRRQISGREYAVDSLLLAPRREQLLGGPASDPGVSRYLRLPRLPPAVVAKAAEVTRSADTPLDRALAIQSWLRNPDNFTYDLSVSSGTGTSAILAFLRDRRGYCEQFASTMAIMARVLGIPARVNVGFTSGDLQSDGTLVVSSHDAHAWPELFFPGVGWTRFEPTPAAASSGPTMPRWMASPSVSGNPGGDPTPTGSPGTATPSASPSAGAACTGANRTRPDCRDLALPGGPAQTDSSAVPLILLAVALLGLATAVPAIMRAAIGRRRWARAPDAGGRAEAAWAELRDRARDLGYGWPDAQTPRQTADRLTVQGSLHDESARALTRVTRTVEYARYAPASLDWTRRPASDLRHDVHMVCAALAATASRRTRVRAALFPPSSLHLLGRGGGRVVEALDALEERVSRARARLLSPRHTR
jgi:transglutaminase-like putative cysteine protease